MIPAPSPIPAWFLTRLHDTDPGLICYWNGVRGRWTVDRCVNADPHTHSGTCLRANVMLVQGENREYRPLSDNVIDEIRSMDLWAKYDNFGAMMKDDAELEAEGERQRHEPLKQAIADVVEDKLWTRVVGKPLKGESIG